MNTIHQQKLLQVMVLVGIASALLATFAYDPQKAVAANSVSCPIDITLPKDFYELADKGKVTLGTFSVDAGNTASIKITNNTNCSFPVSLASYEVENQTLTDQELYDNQNTVVPAQSSQYVFVSLPACTSQIDLLHDPNRDGPPDPPTYSNPKLIGWTFQLNSKDIPEENDIFHFSPMS